MPARERSPSPRSARQTGGGANRRADRRYPRVSLLHPEVALLPVEHLPFPPAANPPAGLRATVVHVVEAGDQAVPGMIAERDAPPLEADAGGGGAVGDGDVVAVHHVQPAK